jgi:site-specific DNA-methyltransferase (adenine-specific)
MKSLPDKSVDLILCDLPYGCLTGGGITNPATAEKYWKKPPETAIRGCAWDVKIDMKQFWEQVKRIRKNDHSPCIHFCTTKFGFDLYNSNPSEFRYDLVWDKERGVSFLTAGKMPMRSHEMVYVFSKAGAYYNRVDTDEPGKKRNYFKQSTDTLPKTTSIAFTPSSGQIFHKMEDNKRCVVSVVKLENNGRSKKGGHPTEKPIELYKWLIQRYCPVGGTLLDPTAGSFNSCIAGGELGVHCIGIEKDKDFYDKACLKLNAT